MSYTILFNETINKYNNEITFHISTEERAYCYIEEKEIYIPQNIFLSISNTLEHIVTLYHEIGHIKTNNMRMKECEKEYYATQWCFDQLREKKIIIPRYLINEYQNYIWSLRRKNCPSRKELKLIYRKRGK